MDFLVNFFVGSVLHVLFSVIIAFPTIALFYLLRQYYLRTAREVKRLDGVLRSPLYNHVSNSMQANGDIFVICSFG